MTERHPALRFLHHWPTRTLCLVFVILQACSMNWYLMDNLSMTWAAIYGADALVLCLFICAMAMASSNMHEEKHLAHVTKHDVRYLAMTPIAWFVYAVILDIKVAVIFVEFSENLSEDSFFGPNTLKTTMALSGGIFLSYLASQHDLKSGERREVLISLTGTVLFDILDGVDNMENLFDKEVRDTYPAGLADAMIGVCCINFLLAGVPLMTLTVTKFGLKKLIKKYELFHKVAIAYAINLPLFIIRMITWHGLSQGISIFALKNLIALGVTTFELLENHFTQEKHLRKSSHGNGESFDNYHSSDMKYHDVQDSAL